MTAVVPRTQQAAARRERKAGLAVEIVLAYVRVAWLLRRRPLTDAVETLRSPRRRRPGEVDTPRLARAVTRTLWKLPGDTRCLRRSLVLIHLLARRDVAASLVIGVSSLGAEFGAHAWVERDGTPLLPAGSAADRRLVEI